MSKLSILKISHLHQTQVSILIDATLDNVVGHVILVTTWRLTDSAH